MKAITRGQQLDGEPDPADRHRAQQSCFKAQEMSHNGHDTNGELAARNLAIHVAQLKEMRWMLTKALEPSSPALSAFDEGASRLTAALSALDPRRGPGELA
jgi:hypothetical protein